MTTEGVDKLLATIDELTLRLVTIEQATMVLWGLGLQHLDDAALNQFIGCLRQSMRSGDEGSDDEQRVEAALKRIVDGIEVIAKRSDSARMN
ncbi:hypothetical protein [Bradyrhizobium sp. USDA 10063]